MLNYKHTKMKKNLHISAWVAALILFFMAPAQGQTFWGDRKSVV